MAPPALTWALYETGYIKTRKSPDATMRITNGLSGAMAAAEQFGRRLA